MVLATAVKDEAWRLGFDAAAIGPATPPPHGGAFDRWLDDGYAGSMDYLARTRRERRDPAMLLPGVRAVVTVAMSYRPTDEASVLQLVRGEEALAHASAAVAQRLEQQAIFAARQEISSIHVAPTIDRYLIDLVNGTRRPADFDADLGRWINVGASPRGGIALARAWLNQQDFVSPDDVRAVLHPVLRHRMMLSYDAVADGVNADQVLDRLLDKVAIPA